MADRYWVRNGAATSANTATAWNTLADNTGSTGIPLAGDTVHIGHPDTLALNKGYATILWDLSLSLTELITYSGYKSASLISSTIISFTAPNIITLSNTNWEDLGFKAGMQIRITGTAILGNTGNFDIDGITSNVLTTTQTTLTSEAVGATVVIDAGVNFQLETNITTQGFTLDSELVNNTGSNNTITFAGTYLSGNKYVHNGPNAVIPTASQSLITYTFNTSANGTGRCFFDDGPYPITTTTGNSYFTPEYNTPMSTTHGAATFYSMSLGPNSLFQPNSSPSTTATQNASKIFEILTTSTFAIGWSVFDAGFSTFAFTMNAHWTVPVTGDTTYGTAPFKCRFYNLIIRTPTTAGNKASIPPNRTLSVNSLTVEADAVLVGDFTAGSGATSTVISVRRPTIKGSWNFSQLSDGIYVSLMSDTFPITPSDGPAGRVQLSDAGGIFTSDTKFTWTSATSTLLVDGKLTVTGLIDPTGMEFTAVAANPSSANPAKTIWVNSADSDKLYFGSSAVGGGGGGSGITALTGDVTASGSGSVAATIANDSVNDDKLANATLAKVDGALPKSGGTMTGEIEATTISLNAVPADPATDDKVRIGESGAGSNMFMIRSNDGYLMMGPNNTTWAHFQTDRTQFYFNRPLIIDGGQVFAYNDGLKLGTGTTVAAGTTAITIANGSTDITVAGSIAVGGTVDGIDIATDVAANTAKVTNATHTGDVTGATALTIGADKVTEGMLKVSNAPSNGYALTAQSGVTGGLTWAAMGGGGGSYTDADAIAAVEGHADLELTGTVVISDVASASGTDALLELKSVESAQARMFVSADTSAKLPLIHLRDITANSGNRNGNYSAYIALDRASPIVTGSAQNDFLIANGNYNKKIHICTNNAGNGSQAQARMTVDKDGKVGIGTTSPASQLDVAGTIRQTASTNAVLVSNGNGDIVSASNLADVPYIPIGQAEADPFLSAFPPNWAGAPPNTIADALNRIAAQLASLAGPIP